MVATRTISTLRNEKVKTFKAEKITVNGKQYTINVFQINFLDVFRNCKVPGMYYTLYNAAGEFKHEQEYNGTGTKKEIIEDAKKTILVRYN